MPNPNIDLQSTEGQRLADSEARRPTGNSGDRI